MSYRVLVDDNYHYMDQGERYTQGKYATYAEALSICRRIVEECLEEGYKPGITASALYGYYTMFGNDPFIVEDSESPDLGPGFSAWGYAKARCEELCSRPPEEFRQGG